MRPGVLLHLPALFFFLPFCLSAFFLQFKPFPELPRLPDIALRAFSGSVGRGSLSVALALD